MNIATEITSGTMLAALPLYEALVKARDTIDRMRKVCSDSLVLFQFEEIVRGLEQAFEAALTAAPRCGSVVAGEIMGVSDRQARNLAESGAVIAWQDETGSRWRFDVRSCYAYRDAEGEAAA